MTDDVLGGRPDQRGPLAVPPGHDPATGGESWLPPRRAAATSGVIALIALVMEMKAMMVIPMTGTFIRDAGLSAVAAGWVLLTAQLVGASSITLLGRLGDAYGHRKVMLYVLVGQLIGNLVTGLAANAVMIIAGRALVGASVGAALLMPIMHDWMRPRELRQGIGFFAGVQSIGVAISMCTGGALIAVGLGWRAAFLLSAALSVLCLVLTVRLVPESRRRSHGRIDYLGAAGLAGWLCLLLVYISFSGSVGATSLPMIAIAAAAFIGLALWIIYQRRTPDPLVDLSVATSRRLLPAYLASASMAFCSFVCYIGITNYVQVPPEIAGYGFGFSVLQGGLVLVPIGLLTTVLSLLAGRVLARFGGRTSMAGGSVVLGAGFVFLYFFHTEVRHLIIGSCIFGLGASAVFAGGYAIATLEAPPGKAGVSNGILSVWSSIGGAIGTATSTALTAAERIPGTTFSVEAGWANTFLAAAAAAVIGAIAALFMPRSTGTAIGSDLTAGSTESGAATT